MSIQSAGTAMPPFTFNKFDVEGVFRKNLFEEFFSVRGRKRNGCVWVSMGKGSSDRQHEWLEVKERSGAACCYTRPKPLAWA
jgi:hypothetical protein